MSALGQFFPRRTNDYVPNMQYSADVSPSGLGKVTIPALPAASATAILNAQSIATAGSAVPPSTFSHAVLGRFGRNVTVVASGTATSNVTVYGRDYLGQPMAESFTLTSATPVVGKKAFGSIDKVTFGATAAITINVGTGTVLGLPYKIVDIFSEVVSGVEASSAGTVTLGATTQTLTSADPRGTYTPHSSNVPDGVKTYTIVGYWDTGNLYGPPHVYA